MSKKKRKKRRRLSKTGKLLVTACSLAVSLVFLMGLFYVKKTFLNTEDSPSVSYDTTSMNSYTLVLSEDNPMDKSYLPEDLVNFNDTIQLRKEAADALNEMITAASEEGIVLEIEAGYRTYEDQQNYYSSQLNAIGETNANKNGSNPKINEHPTGLAIDFSSASDLEWLNNHAHEYGFLLRYPETKEIITGVSGNLNHYRYVGKGVAENIFTISANETLEEFLSMNRP